MTLGSSVVREVLSILDKEFPLRRLTAACVFILAGFAFADRSDFDAGVLAWSHEVACQYDQIIASAFSAPQLPAIQVHQGQSGCTVTVRPAAPMVGIDPPSA